MASREALVSVAIPDAVMRLVPGDKVLVTMSNSYSSEEMRPFADMTRARFPGVEFTFVAGIKQVAVQHAEPTNPRELIP